MKHFILSSQKTLFIGALVATTTAASLLVAKSNGQIVPLVFAAGGDNGSHSCFDGYASWTSSSTYRSDAGWSTFFAPMNYFINDGYVSSTNQYPEKIRFDYKAPLQYFGDINGDSLPDFVYAKHERVKFDYSVNPDTDYMTMDDCVYLNTGTGWSPAYRCKSVVTGDNSAGYSTTYYGDCAG